MKSLTKTSPLSGYFYLLTLLLTLSACGGGSSGSANETGAVEGITSGNEQGALAASELRISPDNELRALSDLSIEIDVSATRSFISICPQQEAVVDVATLDYEQCMVRASLDSSLKVIDLPIPNHIDRLVAVIWYYEVGKDPLTRSWQRTADGASASGSIWRITDRN